MKYILLLSLLLLTNPSFAQSDGRMYDIINAISAERLEKDITTLANFGTRHTLSDTISQTRGIGAARRWIKSEFDK
ncbi:MAG: peptidase M28, partial [Bacteroidota bacterium]